MRLHPWRSGFPAGVDSTFLAAVCARAIPDQTLLVHLDSPFVGTPERASFQGLGDTLGLPVLAIPFDPFIQEDVRANGPERCYHCKRAGFSRIAPSRTGARHRLRSRREQCRRCGRNRPPRHAGRCVSSACAPRLWRPLGQRPRNGRCCATGASPVWNLPAGACLATRVATGEPLTPAKLDAARACEDYLHELGCTQVRARIAEGGLRIEGSPQDLALIAVARGTAADGASAHEGQPQLRGDVLAQLRALAREHGIASASPHARPYRRGSMNARP